MYIILHTYMSTPSSPPSPKRIKTSLPTQSPPLLQSSGLRPSQLLRAFGRLFVHRQLGAWLTGGPRGFYNRAFTPLVTLWYLIFQRLCPNHTLSQVVADALDGGADRLSPRGKPLSQQLMSESTTTYSLARQRLPLQAVEKALRHIAQEASATQQIHLWFGLRPGLLDGTTTRMRPFGDIPQHFPPHRPGNCRTVPYWCVARVVGLFCQATGLLMDSAMDSLKTSEQALTALLLKRGWKDWVMVGDRNFGVYTIARATVAAQAHLVARLTQARAKKLAASLGHKLTCGLDVQITWTPSRHDKIPPELEPLPVRGRLVVVRVFRPGFRPLDLYLFTTLTDSGIYTAVELAKLYGTRWQVELCFRYVKDQMDLASFQCQSADMVRKEWLAGLMAYNLVRWVMGLAAENAKVPVALLSFSRTRELICGWLRHCGQRFPSVNSWCRLLNRVGRCRQSKRRKARPSQPRAVRPRRRDYADLKGSRAEACEKLIKANANS